jgi:predicted nucleic acid-binding protein
LDAGPLVAYLIKQESHHEWAKKRFKLVGAPMITCESVLSEAFFLLRRIDRSGKSILDLVDRGVLSIGFSLQQEISFVSSLMKRYANVPMSLADACLVRMAELYREAKVFTLDTDFRIYRKNGRQVIPLLIPE